MRKQISYTEVYNDLDGEVVSLFRVARDHGPELREMLRLTPFSRADFAESYEPSGNPIEQARRTVVRSFMGFGSNAHNRATGFRADSSRNGTTPAHDWAHYPESLDLLIERLRGVVIENRDGKEVMSAHDAPTTLHYVDPPYVAETRDKGPDYRFEMTDDDHAELAKFLRTLKGMVIVSGYDCPLYENLFGDWRTERKRALADGARERIETLWLSPNIVDSGTLGLDFSEPNKPLDTGTE